MAEKPEDLINNEDKVSRAKELFAIGTRNYYVKSYSEAADDLAEACKLFGEVYGVDGDELGEAYLLYAKSLIAIGQEENKLIEVPEEDEDEDEPVEEDDGEEEAPETNGTAENGEKTNGHAETPSEDPQPGPSTSNDNEGSNDAQETENDEADADDGGNLEIAWEVLQNAVVIFERQEKEGLKNLMEVYIEMAGISLENGNFEASTKDFNRALDVFEDLNEADQNPRIAAEVRYKIGLCQMMEKQYDESIKSFQAAADLIADVITKEKSLEAKDEETIKDLEEMHQEILNKITEIGETKAEEIELVKREMTKMFGPGTGGSSDGAGSSSSAGGSSMKSPEEASKPKPTDISHLIKRKKPEGESPVEESPAKKKAVETSPGEKVAVPVEKVVVPVEKVAEEVATVRVVEN